GQLHDAAGRTLTVFGHHQVNLPGALMLGLTPVGPVHDQHTPGVLLDRPGVLQVGGGRHRVGAVLGATVDLAHRHHRDVVVAGDLLEPPHELTHLLGSVFHPLGGGHPPDVVDDDQLGWGALAFQRADTGPDLADRARRRSGDVQRGGHDPLAGLGQLLPLAFGERLAFECAVGDTSFGGVDAVEHHHAVHLQ